MTICPENNQPCLNSADDEELTKLVNAVALSDNSLILFAIAPEIAPNHPVVQEFKTQLQAFDEPERI